MEIQKWLSLANIKLKDSGVESFQLDSLILLENVIRRNKAYILAHKDEELSAEQTLELNILLTRRCNREPIAYITGKKEFYGREFIVNENVLIPRPESEDFIDLLKKHNITHQTIIDVGCGSGILGISTKLELPTNQVTLSDLSSKALKVAKQNAKNLNAKCNFIQSDLLPINGNYSVVLANLPYVPNDMKLQPELTYEPSLALFADNNGMRLYELLWLQINQLTSCKYVLTESLEAQHSEMIRLAKNTNFKLIDKNCLVQLFAPILKDSKT